MKNKIIITSLFAVLLLVSLPTISAINDIYRADSFESDNIKNTVNIDENNKINNSIWELLDIYIEMMYHLRLARVEMWHLLASILGVTGALTTLIDFRAFLLETRAKVSRDVFSEILDVLQVILP